MVKLEKITKDNLEQVLALDILEEQRNYVSSTAHSLAQAWVYKDTAFPFAVYSDGSLVGFVMLGYYEQKKQYTLWKLLIDKQYQNKGYGRAALKLAIEYLKDRFHVTEVFTGVAFGNDVAKHLYQSVGFVETGDVDDFQLEMKLCIDG
ncbi:MAG: GNAT family N-acetyltransferase [Ruminococcaceae bacterium]|nr:GNAT family N-acetyltransferase [Oscillospiraceae bacterium]